MGFLCALIVSDKPPSPFLGKKQKVEMGDGNCIFTSSEVLALAFVFVVELQAFSLISKLLLNLDLVWVFSKVEKHVNNHQACVSGRACIGHFLKASSS